MHALYSSNHHNMTVRDPDKAGGRGSSCSNAAPIFPIPKFRRWTKELNKTLKKETPLNCFCKVKNSSCYQNIFKPIAALSRHFFCRIRIHMKYWMNSLGICCENLWEFECDGINILTPWPIVSYWVLKREYFSQSACAI